MRRPGGLVLLVLFTGCGAAVDEETAPVPPATEASTTTTTTSAPAPSTTIRVSPTTARPSTTVATTRATVASTRAPATTNPTVPTATGGCDPNYAGACIPRGPDVDCGEITAKRFRVVGTDVHRLDADNDGIACES